ncbi:MAG: ATP-binding protein [Phycisphaerales bacterium]|jgi:anti-sigma regulatory factor (Ser/Thr protein kinase)
MSGGADLRIELVSNPAYLCGVRELVHQVMKRCGFAETEASQIALATDEALINVMRHGYDKRHDGRIWMSIEPLGNHDSPDGIRIVIEDEARQVDPDTIKSRPLEEIRPGGLGVHIIREVMDEVRYERRDRVGMRLTMVKRVRTDSGVVSKGEQRG